jgi:ATP-dependent helicase HrpB
LTLPIEAHLGEICRLLELEGRLILEAPPGTGKTTRVPPALLDHFPQGKILVLEPRRLAARWSAARVASELTGQGKSPDLVGYQVRFENHTTPATRLIYMTQGVFSRRLVHQPDLTDVAVVVLDEFHERNLDNDFALAALRAGGNADRPRILVMSATLPEELEAALQAPKLVCPSPLHPLTIGFQATSTIERLPLEVEAALKQWSPLKDSVLVFLPGMREIRACQRQLERLAQQQGARVEILHGSMSREEQDRVLDPQFSKNKRWILATNIAETSLTVPGVRLVVDSGLSRQLQFASGRSLPQLELARVSQFSGIQRAGRAAREGTGRCVRLYSEADFLQRPASTTPEIETADLCDLVLMMAKLNLKVDELPWLTAPNPERWRVASKLLQQLGCIEESGKLTLVGNRASQWPCHPRLSVLIQSGPSSPATTALVALIEAGTPVEHDLLERLPESPTSYAAFLRLKPELGQYARVADRLVSMSKAPKANPLSLLEACLQAFPDRVAQVRRGKDLLLCDGSSFELSQPLAHDPWLLVISMASSTEKNRRAQLTQWIEIEPEYLLDRPELNEVSVLEWSTTWGQAAESVETRYGSLVLDSIKKKASPNLETKQMLVQKAMATAWYRQSLESFEHLKIRCQLAGIQMPVENPQEWLENLCGGCFNLAELEQRARIDHLLTANQNTQLRRACPDSVTLNRRRFPIHYEEGKPPWVAAPLVEFFNCTEGPVAAGQPITLHLLAPNQRPLQITSDLKGFWVKHYPKIRQELCRRYPRHPWPENPLAAQMDWKPTRK